jgi:hypothetical protein
LLQTIAGFLQPLMLYRSSAAAVFMRAALASPDIEQPVMVRKKLPFSPTTFRSD